MHLAAELGYDIAERDITRSELYVADEVFLTGTAAEVLPVRSIDDREIGEGRPGPITLNLQKEFSNVSTGKNKRHLLWLDYVD
jgi:branched-chain amino acid aminotransferase